MGKHRDWTEIAKDYRENGLNYDQLAKKYNVSISTLKKAAARQDWTGTKAKAERRAKTAVKSMKKAVDAVQPKTEPKETEPQEMEPQEMEPETEPATFPRYALSTEVSTEDLLAGMMQRISEAITLVDPGDAQAIKLLTGALKDLYSIGKRNNKDELDIEEQKARIQKLRSEIRVTETEAAGGVIFMPTMDDRPTPPEDANV